MGRRAARRVSAHRRLPCAAPLALFSHVARVPKISPFVGIESCLKNPPALGPAAWPLGYPPPTDIHSPNTNGAYTNLPITPVLWGFYVGLCRKRVRRKSGGGWGAGRNSGPPKNPLCNGGFLWDIVVKGVFQRPALYTSNAFMHPGYLHPSYLHPPKPTHSTNCRETSHT